MSLYQYLTEEKNYTEDDAEETVLRVEAGMSIPKEILNDIAEYYKTLF